MTLRGLPYLLVAAASIVATAMVLAPAQWMATAIERATGGHVQLAEASGSVWRGRAGIVLSPGNEAEAARIALPEPLSWELSPWRLLAGTVDLILTHPSALSQPLRLRSDLSGRIELQASSLRLPAAVLAGLGAPFNTIKPGGAVSVAWQRLRLQRDHIEGDLVGEWRFASSALTTVAPFGHYRLVAQGGFPGTRLTLSTLAGPLELTGSGTIDASGSLRFTGRARALPGTDPSTQAQLAGLVLLLGRRDGDSAILSFGQ